MKSGITIGKKNKREQGQPKLNTQPDIFVFTGERSGDLLGAKILKPLKDLKIQGSLGPELSKLGYEKLFAMEDFQSIGIGLILTSLPKLLRLFYKVKKTILQNNPKVVILIDFVEFNLLMAKSLKKAGFQGKIIQVVCPTIWAWRKGRKKTLEKYFDLLLTIFPFEEKLFDNSPLKAQYIGHPIVDELSNLVQTTNLSFPEGKKVIALFPGSRKKEIQNILKLYLDALCPFTNCEIAISVTGEQQLREIQKIVNKSKLNVHYVSYENRYELMQKADLAIAKLGTVNLELAYFQVPSIIATPLPAFEQYLFQYLFKIFLPHYSLVNLIAKRRIFPEFIAFFATCQNLQGEIKNFLSDSTAKNWCVNGCKEVKDILSNPTKKGLASKLILDLL